MLASAGVFIDYHSHKLSKTSYSLSHDLVEKQSIRLGKLINIECVGSRLGSVPLLGKCKSLPGPLCIGAARALSGADQECTMAAAWPWCWWLNDLAAGPGSLRKAG